MKTIYIIAGVSGAGKSWVLDNLQLKIPMLKSDKIRKLKDLIEVINSQKEDIIMVEKTTLISTLIKNLPDHDVRLLIVAGDFLTVKQQLINRGGKITSSLYKRWNRMSSLAEHHNPVFIGSSTDVKKWLESNIKPNLVYSATFPNGKMYIGQTNKSLEIRKMGHIYSATSKNKRKKTNVLFHKALLKHKDKIVWDVLKDNLSNAEANFFEKKYIKDFDSMVNGYNQTSGGRSNFVHSKQTIELIAKKASAHSLLNWDDNRKKKASSEMKTQWQDPNMASKRPVAIKKARSTTKQRQLTSNDSTVRYSDPNKRNEMATACGAKEFEVTKDGLFVGRWTNAAQCAKDLNLKTKTQISNVLHGRRNTYCGYVFKHVSETND